MNQLKTLCLSLLALWPGASAAMDFSERNALMPRIASLEFVYPPASPSAYDGQARLVVQPDPYGNIQSQSAILLSGPIEKGDADRFISFMENRWTYGQQFILSSPGGNFLEALRIGAWLKELQDPGSQDPPTFNFLVMKGDQCLSACALILAMGGGPGNAYIERGAEVGFHMGILPDEQAQSTAVVRDVMNLTYDIVSEYTQLIEDGGQQPTLLREALKHRDSRSFYYLRGGMRSWQMGFTPVATPESAPQVSLVGLDEGTAIRICNALIYASQKRLSPESRHMVDVEGDFSPYLPDAAIRMKDIFDELGSDHILQGFNEIACTLSRNGNAVSIGIHDPFLPGSAVDTPVCLSNKTVQYWCATSPAPSHPLRVPLLADALGCSEGRLLTTVPDDKDNWTPDWLERLPSRQGIAKRDVNVRATPGLGTSPIATLAQGQKAEILDCALTNDSQGVFFQIRSGDTQGWVSARFLIEEGIFAFPVTN